MHRFPKEYVFQNQTVSGQHINYDCGLTQKETQEYFAGIDQIFLDELLLLPAQNELTRRPSRFALLHSVRKRLSARATASARSHAKCA